eukprot:UN10832
MALLSRRYCLVFFLFLCCFNMYTLRGSMSVAIQPMSCQYNWSTSTQGIILSSFFFGYIFGNIPAGILAAKYGPKIIIVLGIFGPALLTILTPFQLQTESSSLNCKCDASIATNWCFIDNIYLLDEIKCNAQSMRVCGANTTDDSDSTVRLFIINRIASGLLASFTWPALQTILNNWAPNKERSTMIGLSVAGIPFANTITFPISSFIINHSNWQNNFY